MPWNSPPTTLRASAIVLSAAFAIGFVLQSGRTVHAVGPTSCYTDDWKRTEPDYVMFLPETAVGPNGDNEHVIVVETPGGDLLATWTTGEYECAPNSHTLFARSSDGGRSWSEPTIMPGTNDGPMLNGRWGLPIVSNQGRIYFFFNKCKGIWDVSWTLNGALACTYSDDDGRTWKDGGELPFRRRAKYDHPDPKVPCAWIIWQPAIRDAEGRWIVGFTRWSSLEKFPMPKTGYHMDCHAELVRFDNLDEGPTPADLQLTWLPEGDAEVVTVPCPIEPEKSKGYSFAEEPAITLLPDGRLFMVVRTITGFIWYTVSDDDGATWRPTEPLRYYDGGPKVRHPKDTCPLYRLADGRYLLFYHNHDGSEYGAKGPTDMNARRPMFMAVGEFRQGAHQPVWFSDPKLLYDSHGVMVGPGNGGVTGGRIWLSLYGTLIEHKDERTLWYPDRKHFLLGRRISDLMLSDMTVPE